MRGTTARNLRRIAREVGVNPKTTYFHAFIRGVGYYHGSREWDWAERRKKEFAETNSVSRTIVLGICLRRAYQEAKRMYKGLSPTVLAPSTQQVLA